MTVILVPEPAAAEMVPLPLPLVRVKLVVSELVQVTEVVMSCCVLLLGNVARAVNVTLEFAVGVSVDACRLMEVGVPSLTVTVVVAGVAVPKAAEIVVVQTPATVLAGVTKPVLLMVAQLVVPELQPTFPVRSLVEPSL